MIRRSRLPGLAQAPAVAVLLGALWLAGCATQVGPSNGGEESPAAAYTQLGIAYLERGNLQRAMSSLDRALQMAPNDAEALQAMAMVYQRQGESELADATFRRALDADGKATHIAVGARIGGVDAGVVPMARARQPPQVEAGLALPRREVERHPLHAADRERGEQVRDLEGHGRVSGSG